MPLYDFLAPVYDLALERIFRPFRALALERLPEARGASVLDLACGTGQNFHFLADRIGQQGRLVGVDISAGMLRRARRCATQIAWSNVSLLQLDAAQLSAAELETRSGLSAVDGVICTHGFTSMREWRRAFDASWKLLRPGGAYLIHDVDGTKQNLHVRAVERATRCDFSQAVWQPLQEAGVDFQMDYLDPSAHLFGGRLFVAYGRKPSVTTQPSHVSPD